MTEQELAVLGHLTPQDYLQFMQGVWAEVTVLTPGKLRDRELFSRFSSALDELEILVVKKLKQEKEVSPTVLRTLEKFRKEMDVTCLELLEILDECTRTQLKEILR